MSSFLDSWEDQFLFSKYPEFMNGKDSSDTSDMAFAEGGYGPEIIASETMRGAPVAAVTGATLFLPVEVPMEQLDYLEEKFGLEKPDTVEFDLQDPDSYTELLNSLPSGSLQVMHPYPELQEEVYANSQELLEYLNNKKNLPELAPNTPHQEEVSAGELLEQGLSEEMVVKKHSGAAGDGVKITDQTSELEEFLEPGEQVLLQEKVDSSSNYGIQYFIKDGEPEFVGYNEQSTTEDGAFLGVICDLDGKPPEHLEQFGQELAENIAETGYEGFAGIDILEKDGELYAIDPNIRITASTPAFMMQEGLKQEFGEYINLSGLEVEAESYGEVIEKLEELGAAPYCGSGQHGGSYEVFAVTGGKTVEKAESNMQKVQETI